jgi:hypothetical protein
VERASLYTAALALRTACRPPADEYDNEVLEFVDKAKQELQPPDPAKLARLWFFVTTGQALRAGEGRPIAPDCT